MDKTPGVSNNMVYGRRVLPLILALVACVMWVSAAHAQEAPFNSQYDPPPTNPPICGPEDGGTGGSGVAGDSDPGASGGAEGAGGAESGCEEPQVLSTEAGPAEDSVGILPTTGGILAAPILLGMAAIAAAGVITVRRWNR